MTINCLNCGHGFDVGEAYDDYQGQVKCWVCGALLELCSQDGAIKSLKLARAHGSTTDISPKGTPTKENE